MPDMTGSMAARRWAPLLIACALLGGHAVAADATSARERQRIALLEAGKVRDYAGTAWIRRAKYDTPHYHLETDLPSDAARYVQSLLEAMFSFYGKRLGAAPTGKMTVYVFAHVSDFAEESRTTLHHEVRPGESGMFVKEMQAIYLPWALLHDGSQPGKILIHEGFHQFYDAILKTGDPTWINEALAVGFEDAEFDGARLVDGGISSSKLKGMQALFAKGGEDSLHDLMTMPRDRFVGNQYCEAWSFVFWLMWGEPDAAKRALRQKKLMGYVSALGDAGKRTPEAFEHALGISLVEATPAWKAFVQKLDAADRGGGLDYYPKPGP
jgi:hypothetical protein